MKSKLGTLLVIVLSALTMLFPLAETAKAFGDGYKLSKVQIVWEILYPVEGDNAPQIMEVWKRGHWPFLAANRTVGYDYYVHQPLVVPKGSRKLGIGGEIRSDGSPKATIIPVIDGPWKDSLFLDGRNYKSVIGAKWVRDFDIEDIRIDLTQLAMEGFYGTHAILFLKNRGGSVRNVEIFGGTFDGSNPLVAGGDWGGIKLGYSMNTEVSNCYIHDLGSVARVVGESIPNEGLRIEGSLANVHNNKFERVAISIEAVQTPKSGIYSSSGTHIIDNDITGVSPSPNPNTPASRGIKLAACGDDVLPLEFFLIAGNTIRNSGGHNGIVGGVGIYLNVGVSNTTVIANKVYGDAITEFALQVQDGSKECRKVCSNNIFIGNTFLSGSHDSSFGVAWTTDAPLPKDFLKDNGYPTIRFVNH